MKKKIRKMKISWRLFSKAAKFSFLMITSYEFRRSLANTLHEAKKTVERNYPEVNDTIIREFFVIYGDISCITPWGAGKKQKAKNKGGFEKNKKLKIRWR